MTDDGPEQYLRKISEGITILNDRVEVQEENRQLRRQVQLAERFNLLISIAILSGLLTYYSRNPGTGILGCVSGVSGPLCAIKAVSSLSLIYIPGKLFTTTIRPVTDSEAAELLNDIVLPSLHVFVVISIVPLLGLYFLFPELSHKYFSIIYIAVAVLLSTVPACWYSKRYRETMEKVRTASTQRNIIATTGRGDQDGKIRLTNPNSKPISREEVQFQISHPSNVEVELQRTTGDGPYHLDDDLPASSVVDIPISIDPLPLSESPEGEVEITIDLPNQATQKETIRYGIEEDHSGTTNIG